MSDQPNPSITRTLLANASWLLWVVAISIITLTHRLSFWFPAEAFSLCLICLGFFCGLATLAAVPREGAGSILKSALLGIVLNGIILAIAIPNFIHGRNEALQAKAATTAAITAQAANAAGNADGSWKEYNLAGVQLASPVALYKKDIAAEGTTQPVEFYTGQLLPSALTVALSRRELDTNEDSALADLAPAEADLVRQRFPQGFETSSSEAQVDGIPARRLNVQFITRGTPVQATTIMFVKQPFIWEVKIVGPKNLPGLDADTDKVFNSIQLDPVQTAAN